MFQRGLISTTDELLMSPNVTLLTIGLGGDGFENSNQLCVVAHFYFETLLRETHTLSSHGNGRLFRRHRGQRWSVGRQRCHGALTRLPGRLLVEYAHSPVGAARGRVRLDGLDLHPQQQVLTNVT